MNRSRIRPVSKRRAAQSRAPIRQQSSKARQIAKTRREMRPPPGTPCEARLSMCEGVGVTHHEVLSRARGGSPIDPANMLWICDACHFWTTTHPKEATELGLLRSAFGGEQ